MVFTTELSRLQRRLLRAAGHEPMSMTLDSSRQSSAPREATRGEMQIAGVDPGYTGVRQGRSRPSGQEGSSLSCNRFQRMASHRAGRRVLLGRVRTLRMQTDHADRGVAATLSWQGSRRQLPLGYSIEPAG